MIEVKNGLAMRSPIPPFLLGLAASSLLDLSWTDPALGVSDAAWWPEVDESAPLAAGKKYGAETLTPDPVRKVVVVTREQVSLSVEDKAELAAQSGRQIAERRYQAEVAGCTVAGMHIDTDDRSKLLINGAVVEAMIDPTYALAWKTSTGVVPLTAEQVIGVGRAVRAHVQACFDREAELLAAVEAGTFTPEMLEQGWPE